MKIIELNKNLMRLVLIIAAQSIYAYLHTSRHSFSDEHSMMMSWESAVESVCKLSLPMLALPPCSTMCLIAQLCSLTTRALSLTVGSLFNTLQQFPNSL